jgi:hypothetical protein
MSAATLSQDSIVAFENRHRYAPYKSEVGLSSRLVLTSTATGRWCCS